MSGILSTRLILRLGMLGVLIICFGILLRSTSDARRPFEMIAPTTVDPIQAPDIDIATQPSSPLSISDARVVSVDTQNIEISFKLTNVLKKTIRAYVIRQDMEAGEGHVNTVSVYNLDLTDSELLPDESMTNFEAYQVPSGKRYRIVLSVDYVDFSDGSKWGNDSTNAGERIAAQRAGVRELSKRLKHVLDKQWQN